MLAEDRMMLLRRLILLACLSTLCVLAAHSQTAGPQGASKPKVRTIAAFVKVDAANYEGQVRDALAMLRNAQRAYEQHGYQVETVRIITQPFPQIIRGLSEEQAMAFFRGFDQLAKRESFLPNIGPAMLSDSDPQANADLMARVLAQTEQLNASLVVAGEDGIHWNAVRAAARALKYLSEHSPHSQATFRFATTAMLAPYGPFFPGSYHTGAGHQFAVGLEAANVVQDVFAAHPGNFEAAAQALTAELTRYDVECEQIARQVETRSGWTYMGLDPTPAPLGTVSMGEAIEKLTGAKFGSSGTMTAAATITRAVKAVPVKQVGYAGLMVPVLEDTVLAQRWTESTYSIDSLLAYSAVCGTGLDTVPLPGDVTEEQLARIFGDMASLAYKWKKPLSARLQPVAGKKAGDKTEFDDPRLANAVLQKLP